MSIPSSSLPVPPATETVAQVSYPRVEASTNAAMLCLLILGGAMLGALVGLQAHWIATLFKLHGFHWGNAETVEALTWQWALGGAIVVTLGIGYFALVQPWLDRQMRQ